LYRRVTHEKSCMNARYKEFDSVRKKYPTITFEQFIRIQLLYFGINDNGKDSFPDPTSHIELIVEIPDIMSIPVLTFLSPKSPYQLIRSNSTQVLLKGTDRVGEVTSFEERLFNTRNTEPFYFYVKEVNGDLVLKLNPQQLCRFFVDRNQKPCVFCFRTDAVGRFRNIKAIDLVKQIKEKELKKDNLSTLRAIDEISLITGTYENDEVYLQEMDMLIRGVQSMIGRPVRTVVGSHEAKGPQSLERLKKSGATVFAFSVETLTDEARKKSMQNAKGKRPMKELLEDIRESIRIFGENGTIIRLVLGIEVLNRDSIGIIEDISRLNPIWNLNIYMPFTHAHWTQFTRTRPYTPDDLYAWCHTFNTYIKPDRFMRFKVSP
jgi:hypothetical protein